MRHFGQKLGISSHKFILEECELEECELEGTV